MDANAYRSCLLCPRACGVDRTAGEIGVCRVGSELRVARAALHPWEEPCLVGDKGSGAVFFSGCGLGCVYCQNRAISRGEAGAAISVGRLSEIFLELQEAGAANINLVTGTQFVPSILVSLASAKERGLSLPVVWNTGGYESEATLDALSGAVDIFLPDLKYATNETAREYSRAPDYPAVALSAIEKMLSISGAPVFSDDGRLKRGTVVRLLLLPGRLLEAKTALTRVFRLCGNRVIYSLMRQYTPQPGLPSPLDRRVTDREYSSLVDHAVSLGIERGYTQDKDCAEESFIPAFDLTGVLPEPSGASNRKTYRTANRSDLGTKRYGRNRKEPNL